QRRGKDVALRRAHAELAQVHDLLEVLHAFRNHVHAHVVREVDQGLDDGGRIAVGADGVDEHLVDLDDVDAELEDVGQPAVAGADVVDGDAYAETLQRSDDLPGLGQVLDRIAL